MELHIDPIQKAGIFSVTHHSVGRTLVLQIRHQLLRELREMLAERGSDVDHSHDLPLGSALCATEMETAALVLA